MVKLEKETIVAQIGNKKCEKTGAVNMPIYLSTAYRHEDLGRSTGFDYTRTGNPTRDALQEALAVLEGGYQAFATSSGMSAIQLVFEKFQTGDHIISIQDVYGGSFRFFRQIEAKYQISFSYWDGRALSDLALLVRPESKAIFIETPSNPLMRELDLAELARFAKQHHLLLIVDNTFYTPVFQQPLALGADIVLHSATKYLGGHNDVLAGAVIVKDPTLAAFYEETLNAIGCVLAPFDCWLLIRGLKTLYLRMKQHQENARAVAAFLAEHPLVQQVLYPGKGGMISFYIQDEKLVSPLLRALELFTFAESLGGVESLITYPATQTHADIPKDVRDAYGLTNQLVRLSVGIEAKQDLIADLSQGLAKVEAEVGAR
ncbi:aminotransferase class I/II-fold pyridoxal phosphate-dependent enzyme [Listeria costaricensis]|uniref:aminotransferase class I/II-fold pyridoxal phosphate-dependent enzyme n=1 Tax=Listeria costaricensis TaxID=2026604 RepID=UPI000C08631F|nr:aminotransferase class I/II-fold pyridoxal phosphate-dependent enzyme [Listeria costaricensis]